MNLERFNGTLIEIYEAGLGRTSWESALQHMLDFVGLPSGCIQFQNRRTGQGQFLASNEFDPLELERILGKDWAHHDVWANALDHIPEQQQIIIGSQLVPQAEYESSLIYNEFFRYQHHDVADTLSGFSRPNEYTLAVAPFYRAGQSDPFESQTVERYKMLWPHVSRSMEVFARADDNLSSDLTSGGRMDAQDVALFGVDARGQLVRHNKTAEQMLSEQLFFKKIGSQLTCTSSENARKLREVIETAAPETVFTPRAPQSAYVLLRVDGSPHLCTVFVIPNPDRDSLIGQAYRTDEPDVLVLVSSTTRDNKAKADAIAKLYGLSPAESEVLASFAQGGSPAQVAEETGRHIETVRTQLKSIFAKTNTSSQLELLRMVLNIPAG